MNADPEVMHYFHVLYRRSRPREFKRLLGCEEFSWKYFCQTVSPVMRCITSSARV